MLREPLLILVLLVGLVLWLIAACVAFYFFRPWIRAVMNGVPVQLTNLIAMRLRGTPARLVVDAYIQLRHRGLTVSLAEVESAYIANAQRIRNHGDLVDFVEERQNKADKR